MLLLRIFIPILLIFCTSCGAVKKDLSPLNIGRHKIDNKLVEALDEEFIASSSSKHKSQLVDMSPDEVVNSLFNGDIDVYIGTTEIAENYTNSIKKIPIAKDGLVVVVHPANPIRNISKKNLVNIYSKVISNWKEVGGNNQPIMIVDRKDSKLEWKIISKLIFNSSVISMDNVMVENQAEVVKTLMKFPNALSYLNFSSLAGTKLKVLNIDNIPPTFMNISKGYFPLARPLYIYFNEEKLKENNKYEAFKDFAAFINGAKGQEVIRAKGLIPLTEAEQKLASLDKDPVYLGVAAPLEGVYVDLGRSIVNAAKLAVSETNRAGGIDGRSIELIVCNDKADTSVALECATKFVRKNVFGVIGHLTSQASIEASKIYVKNKIPQISPSTTHPWFTERPGSRGYVFRTSGRDDQQAKIISDTIKELDYQHPLKVTILNNGTVYGSTLSSLIDNEISEAGFDQVVEIRSFEQEQKQFHKEIEDLKSDVLVFVGEYGDAAQIVKGLALANKSDVVFMGADGTYSKRFIEEAGLRAENAYIIGNTSNVDSQAINNFRESFLSEFKMEATAYAMNSYDTAKILIEALKSAKVVNSNLIAQEVQAINYKGITGDISFNSIGDPILPRMAMYKVTDGNFVKQ